MENNAIKKIQASGLPSTREDVQKFAVEINKQLEDGDISGLELLKTFKMIEKLQEYVKDKMMEVAIKEADRNAGKEFEQFGIRFEKVEVGTKYDYSNCNDLTYHSIIRDEEKLKAEKKKREDFLKSINGSETIEDVDTDSGEVQNVTVYPPVKSSTSSLRVLIK